MFSFVQKDLGCVCLCVFVLCIDMWYLGLIIKRFNHIIQVLHLFTQNLFYSGPWCSHVILSDILKAFLLSILIIVTLTSFQFVEGVGCVPHLSSFEISLFIIGFFNYLPIYYGMVIITINIIINFSQECKLQGARILTAMQWSLR